MSEPIRSLGKLFLGIAIAAGACSMAVAAQPSEKPKKAQSASAAALLRFSEPVDGLVGRIEGLRRHLRLR